MSLEKFVERIKSGTDRHVGFSTIDGPPHSQVMLRFPSALIVVGII